MAHLGTVLSARAHRTAHRDVLWPDYPLAEAEPGAGDLGAHLLEPVSAPELGRRLPHPQQRRTLAGRRGAAGPTPARRLDAIARKQVGVRLMRALFEQSCGLLATQDTPGAFAFGLRLMAIDGTLEDVNDTASYTILASYAMA